jgi:DNA polymerase III delta subunit
LFRRKENFAVKFGQESIFSFDTESRDLAMIKQSIYGGGLFVSKKLVILNGIPMDATTKMGEERKKPIDIFIDDFLSREGKIPEETLILFISSKPDKRLKLYKFLERNAVVKEFNQYKDSQLKDFIISQLGGIFIPDDVVEYLLVKV